MTPLPDSTSRTIYNIKYNSHILKSIIKITINDTTLHLLLDTGADISVLKQKSLPTNVTFDVTKKIRIKGINDKMVDSMGLTYLELAFDEQIILNHPLQVVNDDFPIPTDGILGLDFLHKYKCKIDYECLLLKFNINDEPVEVPIYDEIAQCNCTIPARSEKICKINAHVKQDTVIAHDEIQPGIFISNSIISPTEQYVRILNLNSYDADISKMTIQTTKLSNYIQASTQKQTATCNKNKLTDEQRKTRLITLLEPNIPENADRAAIIKLCLEYADIFHLDDEFLTTNNFYTQNLSVEKTSPIYTPNYRLPASQRIEIDRQVQNMLDADIIESSRSPFNSPILLVPKRTTGNAKWRLVIDYRRLNKNLIPDKFPLPRIDDVLDSLGNAIYFSTLDLSSGFHQIPLDKNSREFTAFSTTSGHYHFKRLPFGLNIGSNSFQRMINLALSGLTPDICFIYLDDIIVIGNSPQNHLQNLTKVFQRLRETNLKLNPPKCNFLKKEIQFLGHTITKDGILPDTSKYETILRYPTPKDAEETRRFTAFASYYRRFIRNFASIARPLTQFTKKNVKFVWTDKQQKAFESIKNRLINPPILTYPNFNKDFYLTTDASKIGCGAVLQQLHHDKLLPIAYASKTFNSAESKKAPIELELIAIWWAIKHFRPYLYGRKFMVLTDHKPLVYLYNLKDPSSKLTRMRLDLEEYDFDIGYLKGKTNVVADALSRISIHDLKQLSDENTATMTVLTRAQTRALQNLNPPNASLASPATNDRGTDHPKMYEALNNYDASRRIQIHTNITQHDMNVHLLKNEKAIHTLSVKIHDMNEAALITAFEYALKSIENYVIQMVATNDEIPILALSLRDDVVNALGIQALKKVANNNLKSMKIELFTPRKEVVDEREKQRLLQENHDNPLSGHPGQKRLYKKLRNSYRWKNMKGDIQRYVQSCVHCKLNKVTRHTTTKMTITNTPARPMEIVSIDTVGPLPVSTLLGNRYIVTAQCNLTKYLILIPIPNKETKTLAKALVEKIILIYGPMHSILTDLGTEYISETMKEVLALLHVEHNTSTAYHPATLGSVERSHRVLNEYLRIYSAEQRHAWDEWIPYFSFAYNTTPHTAHNYTPFELFYGRTATLPTNLTNTVDPVYNFDSYQKEVKYRLQTVWQRAQQLLHKDKERRVTNHTKLNELTLNVGDKVKLRKENRNKFDRHYTGPYTVTNMNGPNVTITDGNTTKTVHKDRLCRF